MRAKPVVLFSAIRDGNVIACVTSFYASAVRDEIGKNWAHTGETPAQGWKRAMKAGIRVCKVSVSLVPLVSDEEGTTP